MRVEDLKRGSAGGLDCIASAGELGGNAERWVLLRPSSESRKGEEGAEGCWFHCDLGDGRDWGFSSQLGGGVHGR